MHWHSPMILLGASRIGRATGQLLWHENLISRSHRNGAHDLTLVEMRHMTVLWQSHDRVFRSRDGRGQLLNDCGRVQHVLLTKDVVHRDRYPWRIGEQIQ